jgi:hypothetical protein
MEIKDRRRNKTERFDDKRSNYSLQFLKKLK